MVKNDLNMPKFCSECWKTCLQVISSSDLCTWCRLTNAANTVTCSWWPVDLRFTLKRLLCKSNFLPFWNLQKNLKICAAFCTTIPIETCLTDMIKHYICNIIQSGIFYRYCTLFCRIQGSGCGMYTFIKIYL